VIVVLAVGLPASALLLTRRKKFGRAEKGPARLGGLDDLDRWLADTYKLGRVDRLRVRTAVMQGKDVPSALDTAVRGLAAAVLANQFKIVGRARKLYWLALAGHVVAVPALIWAWTLDRSPVTLSAAAAIAHDRRRCLVEKTPLKNDRPQILTISPIARD